MARATSECKGKCYACGQGTDFVIDKTGTHTYICMECYNSNALRDKLHVVASAGSSRAVKLLQIQDVAKKLK